VEFEGGTPDVGNDEGGVGVGLLHEKVGPCVGEAVGGKSGHGVGNEGGGGMFDNVSNGIGHPLERGGEREFDDGSAYAIPHWLVGKQNPAGEMDGQHDVDGEGDGRGCEARKGGELAVVVQ